ncbi:hypothetical protein OSB04_032154 [Centaurea solstitialis]|uniref:ATP-dependent DNA helicase n=1 Tax=Centaurea solstitialis TaxID=347529 RepID=A0AA38W8U2_9ASTR|nr:hypothetical protein OSB04_032154 [Centaurea solstitialis]
MNVINLTLSVCDSVNLLSHYVLLLQNRTIYKKMTKYVENDVYQVDVDLQKENITNITHSVARNNCGIARSHHPIPNELTTEGTYENFHDVEPSTRVNSVSSTTYNVSQVHVNTRKDKQRAYNREYYAQNKEMMKIKRIANVEGSSRSTPSVDVGASNLMNIVSSIDDDIDQYDLGYDGILTRNIGEEETTQMNTEPLERVSSDVDPSTRVNSVSSITYNVSKVHVNIRKEKRRAYLTEYYARNKERMRIRSITTLEGSSRSTPSVDVGASNVMNIVSSIDDDINQYDSVYDGIPTKHRILPEQNACLYCAAKRLRYESDGFCCMKGNIKLAYSPIPEDLYELFTSQSELGKIEGNDNIIAYKRSIVVYGRSDNSQRIQPYFSCYDHLGYPLFFPNGEVGWHSNIPRYGVSISEIVNKEDNTRNMKRLMNEQVGIMSVCENTIVQDDGKPDMFITVTCNPKLPEILTELLLGQTAQDQPVLVARVFNAKLEDLKKTTFQEGNYWHRQIICVVTIDPDVDWGVINEIKRFRDARYVSPLENPRRRGTMKGRLVYVNPTEGEQFYLRLLLSHITGPTSFEDICIVNGLLHPTFRKAALERGLIEDDNNLSQYLVEASVFQFPVQDMVLTDIMVFLQSMGKDLNDFDLPMVNANSSLQDVGSREVQEEYSIIVEDEYLQARDSLNSDQKSVFDDIMRHVNDDCQGVFFVDGPSGTGKMFLYKALLAEVRSRGLIALATASSGVAANNMPGSGTAQLLRHARLIIWDEASMAKRQAVEALDQTMQDLIGNRLPFGGKIMVMVVFPSLQINGAVSDYIISRVILSTKNHNVDDINDELMKRFCGEEKVYYSFDEAQDDTNNFYPIEFLNSLTDSSLPPHRLRLKLGWPIILLRNINPTSGLCNGTRLICRGFQQNAIDVEIVVGQYARKRVYHEELQKYWSNIPKEFIAMESTHQTWCTKKFYTISKDYPGVLLVDAERTTRVALQMEKSRFIIHDFEQFGLLWPYQQLTMHPRRRYGKDPYAMEVLLKKLYLMRMAADIGITTICLGENRGNENNYERKDFHQLMMFNLDLKRIVLADGPMGIMQSCLDVVLPYVCQQQQFVRPIGEFQVMLVGNHQSTVDIIEDQNLPR